MAESLGLGDKFNVVAWASGVHIYLKHGETATMIAYLSAGNHSVSVNESIDGANERALAAIETIHKGPGLGGTWTKVTQTAAATYAVTDATNNAIVITVRADQLSPGYNSIEFNNTSNRASVYVAGLREPADPENLDSLIAA